MVTIDPLFVLAVALLVAGVVGSFVPLVPGVALSLAGIYVYWWGTGYVEPGLLFVAVATVVGAVTLALDYLSSVISASASGASLRTAAVAGVVGLVLLLVTGPVGMLIGVVVATFVLEYVRSGDVERSLRTGIYTSVGMLASSAMQALITGALLVGFLIAVW
ncbi:DUF456 domain-containing protein [Halalkalicoccus salilacus]|uniref:DUF456 domain-containing protein n=1 Tax=Halalkalicoccus salilacus TaxID=3117459 RepID=UPI00300E9C9B